MTNSKKWLRCALSTALISVSMPSFAEVVVHSSGNGRAAIWTENEADQFLNNNIVPSSATTSSSSTVPSAYNNTTEKTKPVVPSAYNNTDSSYKNQVTQQYPVSSYAANDEYNSDVSTSKPNVNARAALVMDGRTGEVLYSKNTNSVLPIASITKVMTAIVTMDARLDMNEYITLTASDFSGAGGKNSSSTLRVGDTMTRSEALLFALMKSENPAAAALARTYPSGRNAFIAAMNEKARSIGMTGSRFTESTGLDPRNVSSARDLALMVREAAKYHLIRQYSTTASHSFDLGYRILPSRNTNALVRNGGWNMELSKTGYIREAGRCVVMQTNINARPLVVILLGATDSQARTNDATRLFNWVARLPQGV